MSSDDAFMYYWNAGPVEKRWEKLLLDWINKCVAPVEEFRYLSGRTLAEIVSKYKTDVCHEDFDRAMLCTNDIEPFLNYKYPILRLGYYADDKDLLRKHYIMHLTLLFHCCMNSETGEIDRDICARLQREEQEVILKFCEYLTEMEVTLNNVEYCSSRACEDVFHITNNKQPNPYLNELYAVSSNSTNKHSLMTLSSNTTYGEQVKKKQNLKFKSSVTVLPSIVTDTSSYSKTSLDANNASDNSNASSVTTSKTINNQKGNSSGENHNLSNIYNTGHIRDDMQKSKKNADDHGRCKRGCKCPRCTSEGPASGEPGSSHVCYKKDNEIKNSESTQFPFKLLNYFIIAGVGIILFALLVSLAIMPLRNKAHFKQINDVDVADLLKNIERY